MISADGWSAQEDRIAQIRELHKPASGYFRRYCNGCDGGWQDLARWPCRTAELLYTPAEIAAVYARPEGVT